MFIENKTEKPECYMPNNDTYPLCRGKENNDKCVYCCLYDDMVGPHDYD